MFMSYFKIICKVLCLYLIIILKYTCTISHNQYWKVGTTEHMVFTMWSKSVLEKAIALDVHEFTESITEHAFHPGLGLFISP